MPNDDSFFKASLISSSQLWPSVAACCSEWQLQAEGCDVGINRRGRIFAGHGPRRYFFVGFADTFFLSIVFFTPLFLGAAARTFAIRQSLSPTQRRNLRSSARPLAHPPSA
jgi:hypothetical protein